MSSRQPPRERERSSAVLADEAQALRLRGVDKVYLLGGARVDVLGGIDTATVNDLGPTDLTSVVVNLAVNGLGDAAADAVTVNGTTAVDLVNVSGSAGSVLVQQVAYGVSLLGAESSNDTFTANLSNGDDIFSAAGLAATSLQHLTVSGGNGNDILVGSQGADTLNGDANTDYIDGGAGIDAQTGGETVVNVP